MSNHDNGPYQKFRDSHQILLGGKKQQKYYIKDELKINNNDCVLHLQLNLMFVIFGKIFFISAPKMQHCFPLNLIVNIRI